MGKQSIDRANDTSIQPIDAAYDALELDNNISTEVTSAGERIVIGPDFQNGVKCIHRFVDRVCDLEDPAYRLVKHSSGPMLALRTRLSTIPSGCLITPEFRDSYELSEQVNAFLDVEELLQWEKERPFNPLAPSKTQPGKLVADVANQFVKAIRDRATTKDFRTRLSVRRFRSKRNYLRGKHLISALFRRHARLNAIRIDFGYLTEHPASLEQSKEDFARFLNNHRHHTIFRNLVGYIWHLEWAFRTGYHWHVVLFFDGSKTLRDAYIARLIGEYWVRGITQGRGRYHNCNADKNKYRRLGIGMISHDDAGKRSVLEGKVLEYLTTIDELAQPRVPRGTKVFGTSQMPDDHPGTGRKRRT
jgi:hypothetical protein